MIRAWAIAGVLLSLSLAACNPTPGRGDRVRQLVFADAITPVSLDPGFVSTDGEYPIQQLLYEQLTVLDPAAPDAVRPGLAKDWQRSADGLRIEMRLAPGHRFSDGTPVTAEAVKLSLERVVAIGRGPSVFLSWLDHVEVERPDRLMLVLKHPFGPALQLLSHPACSILNPRQVRAHMRGQDWAQSWLATNSAGSGPYTLKSIRPGESVTLSANPLAFSPPKQFTQIRWMALPDEGVRRLLLERGDVDVMTNISAAFVDRYRALPGVSVKMIPGGASFVFLTLNTRIGPMHNDLLRQAVYEAIDYQGLREKVLSGNTTQLPGYLTPDAPGFDRREAFPQRDLKRARELVAQSGYDGRPLVLLVQLVGPVSEFVQSNLKDAGINVQLEKRSSGATEALRQAGQFDLIYEGWTSDAPDPAPMLQALYTADGRAAGTNVSGMTDPSVDALVGEALASPDPLVRGRLEHQVDLKLRALRPLVMLFSADPVVAYRSDLSGIVLNRYRFDALNLADLTRSTTAARDVAGTQALGPSGER